MITGSEDGTGRGGAAAGASGPQLYIVWNRFQRRPESMRDFYGYEIHYIPSPVSRRWLKPVGYLQQAARTVALIRRTRPRAVWVQLPPNFVLGLVQIACRLFTPGAMVIADCHNASLRSPWLDTPGSQAALAGADAVLVHNDMVLEQARAHGLPADRLHLLETRPARLGREAEPAPPGPGRRAVVLTPCSFHPDEPIAVLLAAAAAAPEFDFRITGDTAKLADQGLLKRAGPNVAFMGFISREAYDRELLGADIVLGLTTLDGVQLSAANEAVGAGVPMVLSDTQLLRRLFAGGAVFALNTAEALAAACREVMTDYAGCVLRVRELRAWREARWRGQAAPVLALIEGREAPVEATA